jgi:hypothetical protein
MMPILWTKSYQLPGGKQGQVLASTIGSSTDQLNAGVRRALVNGVYYLLGMSDQIPTDGTNVELVGDYQPTKYEFRKDEYWKQRKMTVSDYTMK